MDKKGTMNKGQMIAYDTIDDKLIRHIMPKEINCKHLDGIPHPFGREITYMRLKGWNGMAEYVEMMTPLHQYLWWFHNVGLVWSVPKQPPKYIVGCDPYKESAETTVR